MFKNYKYEKPTVISKNSTTALTASFAGGGWLHLTVVTHHLSTSVKSRTL